MPPLVGKDAASILLTYSQLRHSRKKLHKPCHGRQVSQKGFDIKALPPDQAACPALGGVAQVRATGQDLGFA